MDLIEKGVITIATIEKGVSKEGSKYQYLQIRLSDGEPLRRIYLSEIEQYVIDKKLEETE